jgi:hypothetical protein
MLKKYRIFIAKYLLICMISNVVFIPIDAISYSFVLTQVATQLLTYENVIALVGLIANATYNKHQLPTIHDIQRRFATPTPTNIQRTTQKYDINLLIGALEHAAQKTIASEQQAAGIGQQKISTSAQASTLLQAVAQQYLSETLQNKSVFEHNNSIVLDHTSAHIIKETICKLIDSGQTARKILVKSTELQRTQQQLLGAIQDVTYHVASQDGRGCIVVGFSAPKTQPISALSSSNQYLARQFYDIYHLQEAKAEYRNAIECILDLNHPNLTQRVIARLALPSLTFNGSMAPEFNKLISELIPYYFTSNGHLRYDLYRTNIPQTYLKDFLLTFIRNPKYAEFADYFGDKRLELFTHQVGDILLSHNPTKGTASKKLILENPYNALIIKCINAFYDGDIATASSIRDEVQKDIKYVLGHENSWSWHLDKTQYCDYIVHANNVIQQVWSQNYDAVYDSQGIFRYGLHDPLFLQLSKQDLKYITQNPARLQTLNANLIIRHAIKSALQKAWNIPDTAPLVIHNALYRLIDFDGAALKSIPTLINKIFEIINAYDLDHSVINQAFFLENGILKELAHYPHVQTLNMPISIHAPQNIYLKRMLNNLIYIQHAMPNTQASAAATKTIIYIQKALTSSHAEIKKIYQDLAYNLYKEITTKEIINYNAVIKDILLSVSQNTSNRLLLEEFFLSNGLIKDFAHWQDAGLIKLVVNLLDAEEVYPRDFLNNALFAIQITTDEQLKSILQNSLLHFAQKLTYVNSSTWHNAITWYITQNLNSILTATQKNDILAQGFNLDAIIQATKPWVIDALKSINQSIPEHIISQYYTIQIAQALNDYIAQCEPIQHKPTLPSCGTGASTTENIPEYGCGIPIDTSSEISKPSCTPDLHKGDHSCGTGASINQEENSPETECNWSKQHHLPGLLDDVEIDVLVETDQSNSGNNEIDASDHDLPIKQDEPIEVDKPKNIPLEENQQTKPKEDPAKPFPTGVNVIDDHENNELERDQNKIIDETQSTPVLKEAPKKYQKIDIKKFLKDIKNQELKKILEEIIKRWHEKINKPHCRNHGKLLVKGKHIYVPVQLKDIISDELEWEKLSKAYDGTVSVQVPDTDGEKILVWIDYQHIFTPVIKINCETGEIDLAGFHHDYLEQIANSGVLDCNITERYEDGVYDIEWSYNGSPIKPSTLFPADWSKAKVIEMIIKGLVNQKETYLKGNRLEIKANATDSFKIKIILEIQKNINGYKTAKLITAYPIKK